MHHLLQIAETQFSLENNHIFYSLTSSDVTLQGFGKYIIDKLFARND